MDITVVHKQDRFSKMVICVSCETSVEARFEDEIQLIVNWNELINEREKELEKARRANDWIDERWPYKWIL
jgi:hypothetical protein